MQTGSFKLKKNFSECSFRIIQPYGWKTFIQQAGFLISTKIGAQTDIISICMFNSSNPNFKNYFLRFVFFSTKTDYWENISLMWVANKKKNYIKLYFYIHTVRCWDALIIPFVVFKWPKFFFIQRLQRIHFPGNGCISFKEHQQTDDTFTLSRSSTLKASCNKFRSNSVESEGSSKNKRCSLMSV